MRDGVNKIFNFIIHQRSLLKINQLCTSVKRVLTKTDVKHSKTHKDLKSIDKDFNYSHTNPDIPTYLFPNTSHPFLI